MGKWCSTAPPALIRLYESGQVRKGHDLLERLLCDERLQDTWRHFSAFTLTEGDWQDIWKDIVFAKHKSSQAGRRLKQGTRTNRTDEVKGYEAIANKATELVRLVRERGDALDVLIDRLLTESHRSILATQKLEDSPLWPTVVEFLEELSNYAHRAAEEAKSKVIPDQRGSGWVQERVFVFHLATAFMIRFKNPMPDIVADIMSVVFPHTLITGIQDFVKTVLRRAKVRKSPKT